MLLILILFVFPMRRHFCLHSLSHRRLICLLFGGKGESYGRNVIGNWTTLQFFNVIKRTMVFSELFALSFSFSICFPPFHSPVEIDCATNIDYSIHATVVEKENDWMASIRGK